MPPPDGFSWIEQPLIAALARPSSAEDLLWLRQEGIELLISLTEERPRRDWSNDAGLLVFHEPIGSGPPEIGARLLAFCFVIAGAALMPSPTRAAIR